ncbi:MAG TPA: VWA domain-containing protein [Pirellulales bacterium]|nr:VWA domain-containing protein [Pirellulales bacterium]
MCRRRCLASRLWLSLLILSACAGSLRAAGHARAADNARAAGHAKADGGGRAARLDTFIAPDGQGYFALSLSPQWAQPKRTGNDLVVLFDTSASQAGAVREKALAAVEALLASLDGDDRVALLAVDVNAVALTPSLVAPDSEELRQAMVGLRRRVPLGSTDMHRAMEAAAEVFAAGAAAGRPRSVAYLGDGMSTARLIATWRMEQLVGKLVDARVSVNSLAIGPRLDNELLGALANHTGGRVIVDQDDSSARQIGQALADAAHGAVVWPTALELPASFSEVFPRRCPPLRFDRDTILLGKLDGGKLDGGKLGGDKPAIRQRPSLPVRMRAELAGKAVQLDWNVLADDASDDHAYLAKLVSALESNGGIALAAVGSAGLAELRLGLNAGARNLVRLGEQALVTGNLNEAGHLADEAIRFDPMNPQAATVRRAVDKALGCGPAARARDAGSADFNSPSLAAGKGGPAAEGELLDGQLLDQVERRRRVFEGFLRSEVRNEVNRARRMMSTDAEKARAMLKLLLEKVEQSTELKSDVRAQMAGQIRAALRAAGRQELVQSERDLRKRQVAAEVEARERINRDMFVREQKVEQLMARFSALMDEERYRDAEAVADLAEDMESNRPGLRTAELYSRMVGYTTDLVAVRDARHRGFADMLYATETSNIPISDNTPLLYPAPEVWQMLTERRKKYRAVDLSKSSPAEAKITEALSNTTELDFTDQPLSDVIEYLKDKHQIEVQFDNKAMTDAGVGSDTAVTRTIKGVTLRSALRLLLGDLDLTYVIKDEVLMVTTKTEAENILTTKVYPVADLVVPVQTQSGGMGGMGGMGGGMLNPMGSMGGGMMGGGMMGGGMMGGMMPGMMGGGMMGGMPGGMMGGMPGGMMGGGMF